MTGNQVVIILFGLIYFGYILYSRRKGDFNEFSVAGRSLGTFVIFATLSASWIGPASTLGISRNGFANGWMLNYIGTFAGLGLAIIGLIFAAKIRAKFTDSYSIGDIVAGPSTHNHKAVRIIYGIGAGLFMAAITVVMSYAGGELVNNVFGFSKLWSIVIITLVVILYASFGGIRSTIQTDVFQFLHFVILIPILAILLVLHDGFSWEAYQEFTRPRTQAAFDATTPVVFFGMVWYWLISGGLDASFVNRYMASQTPQVARKATILAGGFYASWVLLMVFIGSAGAFLYPDLANDDQVLLHIAEANFPGILYAIFIIAMIGVVMSSQDSLLNAASIVFSEDVFSLLNDQATDEDKLRYARITTLVVGIVAILVAGFMDSVLDAVITVGSYYLPVVLPVTIFSVLKKRHYWQSALTSMVSGFLTYLTWELKEIEFLPSLFVGVLGSTLAYLATDFYLERIRKKQVGSDNG